MKRKYLLLLVICGVSFFQCTKHIKVAYNIPADYPEDKRKQLTEVLDKGQTLYKANCSDCHGIFTKGKDNIPNFSTTQLDNYSARFIRRDPQNHAVLANMSQAQLNEVLTFLRFKKTTVKDTANANIRPARR